MKSLIITLAITALPALMLIGCREKAQLNASFPDKFEGKEAELMDYMDSTLLSKGTVNNGLVEFTGIDDESVKEPRFTAIMVDGRIRGFYIVEAGTATRDSLGLVHGTPLNDQLAVILEQLDSVDNLDDMGKYVEFVEKKYNENKYNVIGNYLGVELLKFVDANKVDSILNTTPDSFKKSRRALYYINLAKQRAGTSVGMKYTDIDGETAEGEPRKLSNLVVPGKYTLIDFWASWCPYCIKELPDLENLYADYKGKGFEIVGVAVRDNSTDTRTIVKEKNIQWPVLYNTQKVAYDLYGFAGIPHHILLAPDGTIISRGENVARIREHLGSLLP